MLIINADDWGRNRTVTDNSLTCFKNARITSASAMVFMDDSERAAELAREYGLGTGLHLNFTLPFDGNAKSSQLIKSQRRIVSFLKMNKYCSLFYHPGLRQEFEYVYNKEYEEYVRLYRKEPMHIDGHHHMHLCTNMLLDGVIPAGERVRRSFSFWRGEKGIVNRTYRRLVDNRLAGRYHVTDFFFSLEQCLQWKTLGRVAELAGTANVELMTHPDVAGEYAYLMSDAFLEFKRDVAMGTFGML